MSECEAAVIEAKSQAVIDSYRFTRGRKCNWARSLSNLTSAAAQEYEDRFLIELIQNAYDAHDRGTTDGQIYIRFERDERDHGTLYVANAGRPFEEHNFHAMCEIAQSDKLPGSGIGNKGVGFRSVLQISRSPKVYSAGPNYEPKDGTLTGYCFGFATQEDYERLMKDDKDLCQAALNDISPYFLPVVLTDSNEVIRELARLGMVTVIRLPLFSAVSKAAVEKQLDLLQSSTLPILLFLDRIGRLVIQICQSDSKPREFVLFRELTPTYIEDLLDDIQLKFIELSHIDSKNGSGKISSGKFFVASYRVKPELLQAAIRESIQIGKLDETFSNWRDDAYVSVAVRIDTAEETHGLYTFLPMGLNSKSPFAGHLNAPFATKLARTAFSQELPLNDLLLNTAAELCAKMILSMPHSTEEWAKNVGVDLLTWRSPDLRRLVEAFARLGHDIRKENVVPIIPLPNGQSWGSIQNIFEWPDSFGVLTPEALAEASQAHLVLASLGEKRLDRLEEFMSALGRSPKPNPSTVAAWVEMIASYLHTKGCPASVWNEFYDDLARHFTSTGSTLSGRKLLIDDQGVLRNCGPYPPDKLAADRPAVFFPPAKRRTEEDEDIEVIVDISIPSTLSSYACFMHTGLVWYTGERGSRTPAREFLQKSGLVLRYETRDLIEHLSKIMRQVESDQVRSDVLLLVYQLYKAARSSQKLQLDKLGFCVPANNGWIAAREAVFSKKWKDTLGLRIESLIAETRGVSSDLAELESRLIKPPDYPPFSSEEIEDWINFLRSLGVKDGLWPVPLPLKETIVPGAYLTPTRLGKVIGLSQSEIDYWQKANNKPDSRPSLPYDYSIEGNFYRIPGQADSPRFSESARRTFARLVVKGLAVWKEEHFSVKIERPTTRNRHPMNWDTPLAAYIAHAPWIPMVSPGDRDNERFIEICDAWHFRETDGEHPPHFAPWVPHDIRQVIDSSETCLHRLVRIGLKVFNDSTNAGALVMHLGHLLKENVVSEIHLPAFSRAYEKAWTDVIENQLADPFNNSDEGSVLVVSVGANVVTIPLPGEIDSSDDVDSIYVQDAADPFPLSLLENLRRPIFRATESHGLAIANMLRKHWGERVRLISSVQINVLVDGEPLKSCSDTGLLLTEELLWLKDLIALVIDLKSRMSHRSEAAQSEVQRKLMSIRMRWAKKTTIIVDGIQTSLPTFLKGVIAIKHLDFPVIAKVGDGYAMDWNALVEISAALAQIINRTAIEAELKLAIIQLRDRLKVESIAPPSDEDFAVVLGTSCEHVRRIRLSMRGRAVALLYYLHPIVHHFLGLEASAVFSEENESLTSEEAVLKMLEPLRQKLPVCPSDLIQECARAEGLESLRDVLGIPYQEFNATLRSLSPKYKSFHNPCGQSNEFDRFKLKNRNQILSALRERFMSDYLDAKPLSTYVRMRDLSGLTPDPEWLDICHLPTEAMMEHRTNAWLATVGAGLLGENGNRVDDLEKIGAENRKAVRSMGDLISTLVRAWCHKNSFPIPRFWTEIDSGAGLAATMDAEGQLDFKQSGKQEILRWLATNGHWPISMPQSIDLQELALTLTDIDAQGKEARMLEEKTQYENRTIEIGGKRFGTKPGEVSALIDAVQSDITEEFLNCSTNAAKVEDEKSGSGKEKITRASEGKIHKNRSLKRLSEDQKSAIGVVGEILAYQWLKKHYDPVDWKSENRNLYFGGNSGEDRIGYDFTAFEGKRELLFEVKATSGDQPMFDLGWSEVRAAQNYNNRRRYRILFICNALNPATRSLHVLPNPLSDEGQQFYSPVGVGMKYKFRWAD